MFLAVAWAVLRLRPYVGRNLFIVRTDLQAFKWMLDLKQSSDRLARWRLRLTKLGLEIQHRPGRKNIEADALPGLATT